jgi:hypothetical protein
MVVVVRSGAASTGDGLWVLTTCSQRCWPPRRPTLTAGRAAAQGSRAGGDDPAARTGVDRDAAAAAARRCFRPDLYRAILGPRGADLPGASEKLEGALQIPTAVASTRGEMLLGPDWFFDGRTFDPDAPA